MEDRKSPPTVLILLAALLGVYAMPRGGTSSVSPAPNVTPVKRAGESPTTPKPAEPQPAPTASKNPDLAVLAPLLELSDDGSSGRLEDVSAAYRFDRAGRKAIVHKIVSAAARRGGDVRAMIALLPDPVRTSATQDYDLKLDGLSRAAEAAGLVLAHFRFPWDEIDKSERASTDKARDEERNTSVAEKALQPAVGGTTSDELHSDGRMRARPRQADQPGLLVFRKEQTLLAVFLVLETPTRGLRKHQLNWSLDLLDAFADENPEYAEADSRTFQILGPSYTGTQNSLNHGIDGWLTGDPSERLPKSSADAPVRVRTYRFSIAASATEIDIDKLKKLRSVDKLKKLHFVDEMKDKSKVWPPEVIFRSATNRRVAVTRALTNFLVEQYGLKKFALLVESNTLLGKILADKPKTRTDAANPPARVYPYPLHKVETRDARLPAEVYQYPLHIASLRATYEKQGMLHDVGAQVFHSAGRLQVAPEEGELRRDIFPPATPEFSIRVDELTMVQTMTEIARRISLGDYDAVGIAGSSSVDVIFLARLVRKYAPNAILFCNTSDLLFTQPQTISDLRGMLVGSSYPLYAPNRLWSDPYHLPRKTVFFSQDGVQAFYNATMCVLSEMFDDDVRKLALPREFSAPFSEVRAHPRPPIWISVVGNRGMYPLHVAYADHSNETRPDAWPALADVANAKQDLPEYLPSYHPFWRILEILLVLFGLLMLVLAALEFCVGACPDQSMGSLWVHGLEDLCAVGLVSGVVARMELAPERTSNAFPALIRGPRTGRAPHLGSRRFSSGLSHDELALFVTGDRCSDSRRLLVLAGASRVCHWYRRSRHLGRVLARARGRKAVGRTYCAHGGRCRFAAHG